MRQSSKAPTWKLYSISLGSLHALARAVHEALAKRRLYLESKHFHSWVCGGGSATWHIQRVLCEFDTTLNPTVTSGMVGDLRSHPPPQVLWCKPYVYSWVHIHSSHTVDSVPYTYFTAFSLSIKNYVQHNPRLGYLLPLSTRGRRAALAEALGS